MKGLVLGLSVNTFSAKLSKLYVLQLENTWGKKKQLDRTTVATTALSKEKLKKNSFPLRMLTSLEKIIFISIFNCLVRIRIPLKIFHVFFTMALLKRKIERKKDHKPSNFQPKIVK